MKTDTTPTSVETGAVEDAGFRRVVYTSTATRPVTTDFLIGILAQSRPANGIDGISGILLSDGTGFLQVLEGPPAAVEETFRRIVADPRHEDVQVLEQSLHRERMFGGWAMASPEPREDGAVVRERLDALLRNATPAMRNLFVRHSAGLPTRGNRI